MNNTIYIFGNFGSGSVQYPEDYTKEFLSKLSVPNNSKSQLVIHRSDDLMYYSYIRRLADPTQFIGICVEVNGIYIKDIRKLFAFFETACPDLMASKSKIVGYDRDSNLVPLVKDFTNVSLVKEVSDVIQKEMDQRLSQGTLSNAMLPPINNAFSNSTRNTFDKNNSDDEIAQASVNYAYTYVTNRKNKENSINNNKFQEASNRLSNNIRKNKGKLLIALAVTIVTAFSIYAYTQLRGGKDLNQSFMQPLGTYWVKQMSDEDPSFKDFYAVATKLRESAISSKDKEKFKSISYNRLRKFLDTCEDQSWYEKEVSEANAVYERNIHAPVVPKVKKIVNKWKSYISDNTIDKYISITAHTGYASSLIFFSKPVWYYSIYELRSGISNAKVSVAIIDNSTGDIAKGTEVYHLNLETLNYYSDSHNTVGLKLLDGSYWDEHHIKIGISSVTLTNGKVIPTDIINSVPSDIKSYIYSPSESKEYNLIRKYIDPKYTSKSVYFNNWILARLKKEDSLCLELLQKADMPIHYVPYSY